MEWKGRQIQGAGDITTAIGAITGPAEATEFLERYVASGVKRDVALRNIGYLAGYHRRETGLRILRLFGTVHPIFGGEWPTPEGALELGKQWAERDRTR